MRQMTPERLLALGASPCISRLLQLHAEHRVLIHRLGRATFPFHYIGFPFNNLHRLGTLYMCYRSCRWDRRAVLRQKCHLYREFEVTGTYLELLKENWMLFVHLSTRRAHDARRASRKLNFYPAPIILESTPKPVCTRQWLRRQAKAIQDRVCKRIRHPRKVFALIVHRL